MEINMEMEEDIIFSHILEEAQFRLRRINMAREKAKRRSIKGGTYAVDVSLNNNQFRFIPRSNFITA